MTKNSHIWQLASDNPQLKTHRARAKEQEIFGSGYDITTEAHRQMWVSMRKSLGRECVEAISVLSRVHRTVGSVQTTHSRKGEGCMVDGVCDESCGGGDHCNWIVATTDDTHLSMGCVSIQPHDLSQPRLVFCAARHASHAYCTTETFKLAQAVLKSQGCTFVRLCGGQTPESEDHETMHWNAKQIRSASKALLGNTPILSETQLVAVIAAAVCPAWGTCMDDYNSPQTAFDSFDLQSYFAQTERQVYKTLGADVNALATSTETNRMHKNHRGLLTFLCGPILNYATREIEDGPFYETAQIMTWQIETCLDKIHLNPQQFLEKSTRDGQAHAQYALEKLKRDERLLLRAVTNQDWDVMRNLLQQDNPPNFTATIENGTYPNNNNVGMTALHFAFRDHAPLDIIREIYKAYPAALHCGERSGLTPGELLGPTNPNNPNYTAEEYEAVTNYKNRIMDGQSSDESDENSSDESGSDEDSGGDCVDDDDDDAACHFCQGAHTSSDCPSLEDES